MMNMKNGLMSHMRRMMIKCEEASMLATREMFDRISMKQKMDLHMHVAGCKHCRKYYRQSIMLNKTIRHIKNNNYVDQLNHRLSVSDKSALQRMINNNIRS